jgi:1-acyl-sn-glycerol-3-phosphate acyltransferase
MLTWDQRLLSRMGAMAIVLAGVFGVAVMAAFDALLQRTVANRFRGRLFGVKDLVCTGALLLATGSLGLPTSFRVDRWIGPLLIGVSLTTGLAGAITLRVRLKRGLDMPWLNFLRQANEFVCRAWWRLEQVGPCTVPRTGPAIITANHRSVPDPALLQASVPYRVLSFLIAAEYTHLPIVRTIVRATQCIPVRRGTRDTSSTKEALRRLESGGVVAIFIEGGISPPNVTPRPKDGVALLALRTGAPVIPAYIWGTRYSKGVFWGCLIRHRAKVRFGAPVDLSDLSGRERDRELVRLATQRIYSAIMSLAPAGATAGQTTISASDPPSERQHGQPQESTI